MSEAKIKARVAGREVASELFGGFLADIPKRFSGHGADFAEAFIERITELLPRREAKQTESPQAQPIARLGAMRIPFGQYNGQCFDLVPLDYLDWLCRSQEDFYKDLRAYLKHPELESRRGESQ